MKKLALIGILAMLAAPLGAQASTDPGLRMDFRLSGALSPTLLAANTPPSAQSAPHVDPHADKRWDILPSDASILAVLRRWAREAGWQISWEVPVDFPATLLGSFNGSFETATEKVFRSLRNSEYPLQACLYEGNKVVRVTRYVGATKECE